jgi:aspartate aminotransferase
VYNDDFVADLVSFCETQGIFLIMDDIYHQLVFRSTPLPSGYDYSTRSVEESFLIITNGVSKTYGMTGFRIGWVVANTRLISLMGRIQSQMTSCAHIVSQAAAVGALTGSQHVTENLRKTIRNNRDLVLRELGSIPGVRITIPEGAFYILPDFREYDADSNRLAAFLLEKVYVVTVPGAAFGMEGYLRLSYAGPQYEVMEGIRRIRWALDPDGPETTYLGDQIITRSWQEGL